METKNKSKKRETLVEALEDMRRGTKLRGYWNSRDLNKILAYHADRIESAWELQKSQSWHHREMEELILRHEKEVAELKKQLSNSAEIRKALELCVKEMCNYCRNEAIARGLELTCADGCEAYKIAKAALSSPAAEQEGKGDGNGK